MRFIDAQLGRILLAAALLIAVAVNVLNTPPAVQPETPERLSRFVKVKLVQTELATASSETFFVADSPNWTHPLDAFVFIPPRQTFVFQPVDLDVPPASIARTPQILPDPGPSLEGASRLPRFEEGAGGGGGNLTPPPGSGGGASISTSGSGLTSGAPAKNPQLAKFSDSELKRMIDTTEMLINSKARTPALETTLQELKTEVAARVGSSSRPSTSTGSGSGSGSGATGAGTGAAVPPSPVFNPFADPPPPPPGKESKSGKDGKEKTK